MNAEEMFIVLIAFLFIVLLVAIIAIILLKKEVKMFRKECDEMLARKGF